MRRIVIIALMAVGVAAIAPAKDYQSSFGFAFSAPDAWLVMTKKELSSNPVFANADAGLKAKVQAGSIEIFYDRATSDDKFTDYVDVKLGPKGTIPATPEKLEAACTAYSQALAKAAGRKLTIAKCQTLDLGGQKALYIEYEGRVAGTVTMQYQLVRPDGKIVYLTATCKQSSLDKVRPDFEAIVKSVKFS